MTNPSLAPPTPKGRIPHDDPLCHQIGFPEDQDLNIHQSLGIHPFEVINKAEELENYKEENPGFEVDGFWEQDEHGEGNSVSEHMDEVQVESAYDESIEQELLCLTEFEHVDPDQQNLYKNQNER